MYMSEDFSKKVKHMDCDVDEFINVYQSFDKNGRILINELRNAADELEEWTRNCNISTIAASSVALAGGTAAIVGSFLLPPLLVGGIAVTAASTITNLGVQLSRFVILRNAIGKIEKLYEHDRQLARTLDELYQVVLTLNLFDVDNGLHEKGPSSAILDGERTATSLGVLLVSAPARCAAVGVHAVGRSAKSVSNTVQLSSGSAGGLLHIGAGGGNGLILRTVLRGAVVFGLVIDGVTIIISARELAKGTDKKIGHILRKQADMKEEQLDSIKERLAASGLITIQKTKIGNSLC
ncbi:hypothetical protein Tcan_17445 [Toxocara canis]|uniref:Apolipoprotein L3 n=1 Tax=Toxocara canis TaxID=6265 RepID=A0A0B2VN26_TOXCA|nr:hypothetical protein Tcan_17445 [Toxocara canis]